MKKREGILEGVNSCMFDSYSFLLLSRPINLQNWRDWHVKQLK